MNTKFVLGLRRAKQIGLAPLAEVFGICGNLEYKISNNEGQPYFFLLLFFLYRGYFPKIYEIKQNIYFGLC